MAEQYNEITEQNNPQQSGEIDPNQNSQYPQTSCGNNSRMVDHELTQSAQYHTFLDNTAPVYDKIEKKSFAAYYGPNGKLRTIQPLVTRSDLSKYLTKNGSLLKNTRKRFLINDKKNFQSQAYRTKNFCHFVSKSIENELPQKKCAFPLINNRYKYGLTPNYKKSIRYNNNYSLSKNDNYYQNKNTEYETNKNYSCDKFNNNAINLKTVNQDVENVKEDEKCKKDQILNQFYSKNYIVKPEFYRRTFHKAQIFNNYKPYLVENFRMFADYC